MFSLSITKLGAFLSSIITKTIFAEIRDFLRFLKRPRLDPVMDKTLGSWQTRCAIVAMFLIVVQLPLSLISSFVYNSSEITRQISRTNGPHAFMFVVILGPIIEELLFRAGLRSTIYTCFALPVITLCFFLQQPHAEFIVAGTGISFAIVALTLRFSTMRTDWQTLDREFAANYNLIYWTHCTLFASIHTLGLEYEIADLIAIWFLVIPHFAFAAGMGYLRLRDGIHSSILCHSIVNLVGLVYLRVTT